MNDFQNVVLNMYETTDGVCKENADVISTYPPLQDTYKLFKLKLASLNSLAKEQAYDPTGMTEDKQAAKEAMAVLGSEIAKIGYAEALEQNDHKAMAYFDVSYSDIRFVPDNQAANTLKVVIEEARKIPAERLAIFLATDGEIDMLEGYLNTFINTDTERSVASAASVVATRDLAHMFRELKMLLEHKMDLQVSRLKDKHPEFAARYEKARKVLGLSKAKPSVPKEAL